MATKKKKTVKRTARRNPGWISCKGVRVLRDERGKPVAVQVKK